MMAAIRQRVLSVTSSRLSDKEILKVAIACADRDYSTLLDVICTRHTARECKKKYQEIAITHAEFICFFGRKKNNEFISAAGRATSVSELSTDPTFQNVCARIEASLPCTLQEKEPLQIWSQFASRMAVIVALHAEDDEHKRLCSVLGTIVRTDARKIEDLKAQIDEEGADALLLSQALACLVSPLVST